MYFFEKTTMMSKKKKRNFYFLVNPIAGKSRNKQYSLNLINEIHSAQLPAQCFELQYSGQASNKTKDIVQTGGYTIVSVGGDGTFNEIASSLVHTNTPVAIIPRGSGNGLARMIKVPERKRSQTGYLLHSDDQTIDAGKVNNRYFFCTCGFGFDADIAAAFNRGGKQRGGKRYVQKIVEKLRNNTPVEAEFTIDGKLHKGKYFLVTFANANQYGNNAYIAPEADLSDGLLHATLIHPFPSMLAPLMATALLGGFIDKMPYVETIKMRRAEILSVSSPCFHCDGETLEMTYPAKVEVVDSAIRLLIPKRYKNIRPSIPNLRKITAKILAAMEL